MPFFFLLAGILCNPRSTKINLQKKIENFIIPFFLFLAFQALFWTLIDHKFHSFNIGPIWFLLGIFGVELFSQMILRITKGELNDKCSGVHIINEMDVPVLAMGLHDVVISASPEGILVSDKEQSSYIKPFVDKFEQQIMFAEKSWGSFKVVDVETTSLTIKVTLNPGHSMNYHSHKNRDEVWVVISGKNK